MGAGISLELANVRLFLIFGPYSYRLLVPGIGAGNSALRHLWVLSTVAAKTAIYVTLTRPATVAGFGATSTNVVCTSLILYGILRIHSAVKDFAIMIVESAAVYSASVISLMTMYSVGSNAQYTVLDMTGPLIGITFRYIAALLN
ncbi:hypothetical protein PLEOSDRAFT_1087343 [Pleurotus ostreatus PC15]|uniref:Uncharacterized protein n=1 Tax=Pleurotus ostreatus (strain PC15) TaxID=1137138 RepID=A0A067N4W0_PLEO1|nr:hypothetical protein PLEOSDRAFT_1087343 [Pleurotus ostreatus PC15]